MAKQPPPQPLDPDDLETPGHQTPNLLPIPDAARVRAGELADALDLAERDGYIEANILTQLLSLVQEIAPALLAKFVI